jgi:Cohesin domain
VNTLFDVDLDITGVTDLRGFDFNVTWDSSLLKFASVDFNTTLDSVWGNGNWVLAVNQSGVGYYKLVAVSTANGFNSTSTASLARLGFLVQDPQSNQLRQTSIHFDTRKLSDSQYNAITHTVTDGTYQITGITPALELSLTSKTCRKYGETFTVGVDMSNAYNVTDFEFEVDFNTTLLDYSGMIWNAWGTGTVAVDELNGKITGYASGSALNGVQTLITIEFTAAFHRIWKNVSDWTNDQSGKILIQAANLSYSGALKLGYIKDGLNEITVGSDVTYTFSPIQGDIDNDGTVSIFDLRTVAAFYDQQNSTYNLTGDSTIDIYDLVVVGSNFDYTYTQ